MYPSILAGDPGRMLSLELRRAHQCLPKLVQFKAAVGMRRERALSCRRAQTYLGNGHFLRRVCLLLILSTHERTKPVHIIAAL